MMMMMMMITGVFVVFFGVAASAFILTSDSRRPLGLQSDKPS